MASLDTRRPAAQEQLRVLGEQTQVATLPIIAGQNPLQIARRAEDAAKLGGYDVIIYDTAGRVTVDEELMDEVRDVKAAIHPHEVLLVADALTGQDAVNTAKAFDGHIGVTGIVLTRADGDGRGGAALSMRAVTGKPIKLIGVGEKWDALEDFHPGRIASRILGMGDVVSLVEKAAQTIDVEKATKIAEKMKKGSFDLEDLSDQLQQMQKLGGMGGVLGMLPGVAKIKGQINEAGLDKSLVHQRAIISSMTPKERRNPKVLDARRKRRIASGSGTKVEEINKLLKMHRQMADMMKSMGRNGGMLNKFLGRTGGGSLRSRTAIDAGRTRQARSQGARAASGRTQGTGRQRSLRPEWRRPVRTAIGPRPWPSRPGRRRTSERTCPASAAACRSFPAFRERNDDPPSRTHSI